MEFTIFSIIGYVVMLSLSFVKYEWIEKYYIWIIVVFIAILVIINITPLGYTVNGMKIDKYLISNSVLLLMFLPLAAITMNKNKVGGNTCYEIDTIRADKTEIEPGSITATGNAE